MRIEMKATFQFIMNYTLLCEVRNPLKKFGPILLSVL
jgi:hypothetical protein